MATWRERDNGDVELRVFRRNAEDAEPQVVTVTVSNAAGSRDYALLERIQAAFEAAPQ